MNQIGSHGITNDLPFGLEPTPAGGVAMIFQTQKTANRTTDIVALRPSSTHLGPLHATILLQSSMVFFDTPGPLRILQTLCLGHGQIAGSPVLRVAVFSIDPKYFDQ